MAKWKWDNRTKQFLCSECGASPTKYTGCILGEGALKEYKYCRNCGKKITGLTKTIWDVNSNE